MLQFLTSRHDWNALGGAFANSFQAKNDLSDVSELEGQANALLELEESLVYLPEEELKAHDEALKPLVELGLQLSSLALQKKDFLPWLEMVMTKKVYQALANLMQIAHRIHQKIHVILTEPDPDENDPKFQQFLIDWAIEAETEGVPTKASFSARESLASKN